MFASGLLGLSGNSCPGILTCYRWELLATMFKCFVATALYSSELLVELLQVLAAPVYHAVSDFEIGDFSIRPSRT